METNLEVISSNAVCVLFWIILGRLTFLCKYAITGGESHPIYIVTFVGHLI